MPLQCHLMDQVTALRFDVFNLTQGSLAAGYVAWRSVASRGRHFTKLDARDGFGVVSGWFWDGLEMVW